MIMAVLMQREQHYEEVSRRLSVDEAASDGRDMNRFISRTLLAKVLEPHRNIAYLSAASMTFTIRHSVPPTALRRKFSSVALKSMLSIQKFGGKSSSFSNIMINRGRSDEHHFKK